MSNHPNPGHKAVEAQNVATFRPEKWTPPPITAESLALRRESGPRAFISEWCSHDPGAATSRADLWHAYRYWCAITGASPSDRAQLGIAVKELLPAVEIVRPGHQNRAYIYRGLRLPDYRSHQTEAIIAGANRSRVALMNRQGERRMLRLSKLSETDREYVRAWVQDFRAAAEAELKSRSSKMVY